jgi:hypothetical protein
VTDRDDPPVAPFHWGAFYLRVAGATTLLTLVSVAMFVLMHQYLHDWTVIDSRNVRGGQGGGAALLVSTQKLVRMLLEIFDPSWMVWALALGAPAAAVVLISLRIRDVESAGGEGMAAALGARLIAPASLNRVEQFLLECVATQAQARAVTAPPLYLLDELDTVCAATFGSSARDAAIVLSKGAIERLDPAALRALTAWQLAALEGDRIQRDARIAGFLHPLMIPWRLGDAVWTLEDYLRRWAQETGAPGWPSALWRFFSSVGFALHAVRLMLRIAGFPGLAMARLILRHALEEDVLQRDQSVAATLPDRDALAAALAHAVPRDEKIEDIADELFAANASTAEFAHAFFAEPLPVPHEPRLRGIATRLQSHADPLERIRAISPGFDFEAYEKLRATADAGGALPAMAHGAPDESLLARGPLRPESTPAAVRFDATDPAEASRREEFFLRFSRGLLEHFRTPQGASRLLLAAAAPSAPGDAVLKAEVEKLNARERRWVIERCLVPLAAAPEPVRAAHLRAHRIVIEADRRITLDELADWLFVERALVPPGGHVAAAGTTETADAALLLATLAWASAKDESAAASAYARGIIAIGPGAPPALPARRSLAATGIEMALHRLQSGGIAARTTLVKACVAIARNDGSMSEAEEELLRRFCFILSVAPAMLRPSTPAARAAKPAAADAAYPPPGNSAAVRVAPAKWVATARACTRCAGRAELRRYSKPLRDSIADWGIPVLGCVAAGVALFLIDSPQRSLRPGAWIRFFGFWVLSSYAIVLVFSMLVETGPRIFIPRWLNVAGLLVLLAADVVFYFLVPDRGLGTPLGGMLVIGGILVYVLTAKARIPAGYFYFCRACGLIGKIDDTIRGVED